MSKIDLRLYTDMRMSVGFPEHFQSPLAIRIKYYGKIREWLKDKPHTYIFGEGSYYFPTHVEILDPEDAIAFRLVFGV